MDEETVTTPGRGIFTESQREFLRCELEGELGEYKEYQARQYRQRIRENIRGALIDLQFLSNLRFRDQYFAFRPLTGWYDLDILDDRIPDEELAAIEHVEERSPPPDLSVGWGMYNGLTTLLEVFIRLYGVGRFGTVMQRGLDMAVITESLMQNQRLDAYDVRIHRTDPEALEDRYEWLEEPADNGGAADE